MRSKRRKFNVIICFLTTSIILIISGIILVGLRTIIYNKTKEEVFTLTPERKIFEVFKKVPFDLYFDVYFFNWTNPHEFHDLNKKVQVEEVGPFRFLEIIEKTNITFHENNTVSYNRKRRWFFEEKQSAYNLNTLITTINPVAVSGAYTLRFESYFMRKGFSFSLNSVLGKIHITKSVREMLFSGYDEPLIQIAQSIPFVKDRLPPMDKFGWFYERNGSNSFDGRFNMGLGKSDKKFGQIYNWNHWNHTTYYEDKCGDITGSAGDFFPQHLVKGPLEIFNTEMCRTVALDYTGETSRNWIKGYKYEMGDHFLDNGTLIPGNECYCTGECIPYGMLNVSSCRYGSPGFVSLPHFYKADPYYNNLINGMKPSERHNFHMIIEPTTGLPLEVAARLQLNLMVKKVPGISLLDEINDVFFPVIWMEQTVEVPLSYSIPLLVFLWLKEICLFSGILLIISGISLISYTVYGICTMNLCGKEEVKKKYLMKELVPLNGEKFR